MCRALLDQVWRYAKLAYSEINHSLRDQGEKSSFFTHNMILSIFFEYRSFCPNFLQAYSPNRWMDSLALLRICLFAWVRMKVFEDSKFCFAHYLPFVILQKEILRNQNFLLLFLGHIMSKTVHIGDFRRGITTTYFTSKVNVENQYVKFQGF